LLETFFFDDFRLATFFFVGFFLLEAFFFFALAMVNIPSYVLNFQKTSKYRLNLTDFDQFSQLA